MKFKYTGPGYYVTRDGRKALVGEADNECLYGVIYDNHTLEANRWFETGRYYSNRSTTKDLVGPWVEPPKPLELWVNVYKHGTYAHPTEELARRLSGHTNIRVAVHMREVTED